MDGQLDRPLLSATHRLRMTVVLIVMMIIPGLALSGDGTQHIITIQNMAFDPPQLDVKVGDTVTWVNGDFIAHTTTAVDSDWNSGLIAATQSWEMLIGPKTQGEYYCLYHPTMLGTLTIVVDSSSD